MIAEIYNQPHYQIAEMISFVDKDNKGTLLIVYEKDNHTLIAQRMPGSMPVQRFIETMLDVISDLIGLG